MSTRTEAATARPGSSSIRRRCPAAGWATRPTRSSTGSPRPGSPGGRCCRSGRPTATARRTRRLGLRGWPGFLADPEAPVSADEADAFRERHAYWIDGWMRARRARRARRPGALRARVGGAARVRRASAGVRLIGDVPIYVAPGGADHRAWPELFRDGVRGGRAAGRVHRRRASSGATRSTTGRRCSAAATAGGSSGCGRTFELVDIARIDHFRGFVAYWAVPAGTRDDARRPLAARARPSGVRAAAARARRAAA